MKWLVTGAAGQVGSDLVDVLTADRQGDELVALDRASLDVTDASAVRTRITGERPDVVVNCAAWTDVDGAEGDEAAASMVNGEAPGVMAAACARLGARFVHLSSDYVFSGLASAPLPENSPVGPLSAYGRSKLAGEQSALAAGGDAYVIRSSWIYGRTGGNFVKTMLRLLAGDEPLTVVDDQTGSPTWSRDLAEAVVALATARADGPAPGIWHFTDAGATTWWGFARAIAAGAGHDPDRVHPVSTEAFPRPAARPRYSVLSTAKWVAAGLPSPRPWEAALAEALPSIRP